MSTRLTICGNSCDECKAFKENYEKLDERKALSKTWEKYIDFNISPQDIHCNGGTCCAIGLGFVHEGCYYKECTTLHGIEHCGQCSDYPCPQFDDGRNMSELHMREKLGDKFILEEYERYIKVFDNKTWVDKYHEYYFNTKRMTMCGYRCDLCKASASEIKKRDDRTELSRVWKKYYGFYIPPDKIYCEGCRNTNPTAKRIDIECPVRSCVLERKLEHCGDCNKYPCSKSDERKGLSFEKAQKKLSGDFNPDEYNEYLIAYDNETRLSEYKFQEGILYETMEIFLRYFN